MVFSSKNDSRIQFGSLDRPNSGRSTDPPIHGVPRASYVTKPTRQSSFLICWTAIAIDTTGVRCVIVITAIFILNNTPDILGTHNAVIP